MRILLLVIAVFVIILIVAGNNNKDVRPGPDVRIIFSVVANDEEDGKIKRRACSGVYIGSGDILTAKHCSAADGVTIKSIEVTFDQDGREGRDFLAKASWASDTTDISTIKIDSSADVKSAVLACREPMVGEHIEIVGSPLGVEFIHTWGRVSGKTRIVEGDENITPIDAMIASGNSGGPVYDIHGELLGIASAVLDGSARGGIGHVSLMVSSQAACEKFGK